MSTLHYVGLDVHARSIVVAVAGKEGGARVVERLGHDVAGLGKVLARLGEAETVRVVYEAGPTGYGLCRELRRKGYACDVIAPSLIPKRPGDRVKTDRRDARALAELSRAGLLQAVVVPEPCREALRDLVRARESAKAWEKKAGQQLDKFLLRHGRKPSEKMRKWTERHLAWIGSQRFESQALTQVLEEYLAEFVHQVERVKRLDGKLETEAARLPPESQRIVCALTALKGVGFLSAVTLVAELGDIHVRFANPKRLMSYAGVTSRESSSGAVVRRGSITKCGNARVRRIVGEAAWAYTRGRIVPCKKVLDRRRGLGPAVVTVAERADRRLAQRYRRLHLDRGKLKNVVVTALARELLGFVWAVAAAAAQDAPEHGAA